LRIRGYGLVKHATEKITVPRSLDGSFLISSVRYLKTRVPSAYRFICAHICAVKIVLVCGVYLLLFLFFFKFSVFNKKNLFIALDIIGQWGSSVESNQWIC
jgi:hypothetical protein